MNITLRNARRIESSLSNLSIENQVVTVRAYDVSIAKSDMEEGLRSLDDNVDTKLELIRIRHSIKHAINIANMESGVSKLLNTRDMLYANKALYETLGRTDTMERQLDRIEKEPQDSCRVSVVFPNVEAEIAQDIAECDEELHAIGVQLSDINNNHTIEVSEKDIETLRAYGVTV